MYVLFFCLVGFVCLFVLLLPSCYFSKMKEISHYKQKGQGFCNRPHKSKKAGEAEEVKYKCQLGTTLVRKQ